MIPFSFNHGQHGEHGEKKAVVESARITRITRGEGTGPTEGEIRPSEIRRTRRFCRLRDGSCASRYRTRRYRRGQRILAGPRGDRGRGGGIRRGTRRAGQYSSGGRGSSWRLRR